MIRQKMLALFAVLLFLFVPVTVTLAASPAGQTNNITYSANAVPAMMPDCTNTSTGLIPLNDLAGGSYQGFYGGLYPGSNTMPEGHLQAGIGASQTIERLNTLGQPDRYGKIVFLSLGMSNVKQEFAQFMKIAKTEKGPGVVLMNGAQGGYDAPEMADPASNYWPLLESRLTQKNLSPLQVQVVWLKQATAGETGVFPQDAQALQNYLREIVLIAEERFPNLQTIYFSSRIYGGYAQSNYPSPEPWAYQGGFAVKWLIESQITGRDEELAYNNTPWLAWGPYLWADGLTPRSDGLIWECADFSEDGTHPALSAELKVANMLLDFFKNDPTTTWFSRPLRIR